MPTLPIYKTIITPDDIIVVYNLNLIEAIKMWVVKLDSDISIIRAIKMLIVKLSCVFNMIKTHAIKLKINVARQLGRKNCKFFYWSIVTIEDNRMWLQENGYEIKEKKCEKGWDPFVYWIVSW